MYAWIWRHLPGPLWARLSTAVTLTLGLVALLWFFAFPWAEPLLPFDDVQVGTGNGTGTGTEVVPGQDIVPYPTVDNPEPSSTPVPTTSAPVAG